MPQAISGESEHIDQGVARGSPEDYPPFDEPQLSEEKERSLIREIAYCKHALTEAITSNVVNYILSRGFSISEPSEKYLNKAIQFGVEKFIIDRTSKCFAEDLSYSVRDFLSRSTKEAVAIFADDRPKLIEILSHDAFLQCIADVPFNVKSSLSEIEKRVDELVFSHMPMIRRKELKENRQDQHEAYDLIQERFFVARRCAVKVNPDNNPEGHRFSSYVKQSLEWQKSKDERDSSKKNRKTLGNYSLREVIENKREILLKKDVQNGSYAFDDCEDLCALEPFEVLVGKEEQLLMHEALEQLAPKEKAIFWDRHYESWTLSKIANEHDCTMSVVRTALKNASHKIALFLYQKNLDK